MIDPKHVLITGASSGVGAALAMAYTKPGVRLSLHGRNKERLADIAALARQDGAEVTIETGDVTNAPLLAVWINTCDMQQPIELVIANAGVSGGTGDGGETEEQSQAIFAVNYQGVMNTIRPALAGMLKRQSGQIALMSSLASFHGLPGAPTYCASKAAVRIYGEGLRGDLASHGIEVNVICPGFIATPMTAVNDFRMPFVLRAEQAAQIIKKGLALNRGRIAFPWSMYLGTRLLAALPQGMRDRLVSRLPRKPASASLKSSARDH
jgi:short-subunit dehydrogenase